MRTCEEAAMAGAVMCYAGVPVDTAPEPVLYMRPEAPSNRADERRGTDPIQ